MRQRRRWHKRRGVAVRVGRVMDVVGAEVGRGGEGGEGGGGDGGVGGGGGCRAGQ